MNSSATTQVPPPEWDLILGASQKNLPEEIRFLVQQQGVSPSHSNVIDQSALHIAALWGNVESVQTLIELGADVNATNKLTGGTPLHVAIHSRTKTSPERRRECCRLLVEAGADVSIRDVHGSTPADYVPDLNDESLLELLSPNKPEIFQGNNAEELQSMVTRDNVDKTFGGQTLLLKLVQELLQHEQDTGKSADDLIKMIQLLLQHGANPNATPSIGSSVEDTANSDPPLMSVCLALKDLYKNHDSFTEHVQELESVAKLLHQGGANVQELNALVLDGARRNELEFVKFCFSSLDISPNIQGRQGMTPLHFGARSGKTEMVQYLLDNFENLDLEAKNDFGQTALDAARTNNKEEIVALLEQASPKKT